jgi:LPS sulfotransferase NodH
VALPDGWQAPVPIHRQADQLNEEWVAAFHHDHAARRS